MTLKRVLKESIKTACASACGFQAEVPYLFDEFDIPEYVKQEVATRMLRKVLYYGTTFTKGKKREKRHI